MWRSTSSRLGARRPVRPHAVDSAPATINQIPRTIAPFLPSTEVPPSAQQRLHDADFKKRTASREVLHWHSPCCSRGRGRPNRSRARQRKKRPSQKGGPSNAASSDIPFREPGL